MKSFNAIRITGQTLVGSSGSFPRKFGNCFSIEAENGKNYRILNFKVENIKELIKRKVLSWPIKCESLSEHSAVINDGRIPDDWYMDRFCEVCTPIDLLPLPQRLKHLRDIQRGKRIEHENGSISFEIDPVPAKELKVNWKIEKATDLTSEVGEGVEEELSKAITEEIEKYVMPYKGAIEWKEGMPPEWKPMFETESGYFYAPYIPIINKKKEE